MKLFILFKKMENVIFTGDNVPVFPHLLAHYIIDNDLEKVAQLARLVPLESLLVEAVEHEHRDVIELVSKEEAKPNAVFFERDIRNIQVDRPLNANQVAIVNEICVRFNWPVIQLNRNESKESFFEQEENAKVDLDKILAVTNSSLRQQGLTIGKRRQLLLDRARFVRHKWQPNLNVYANDTTEETSSFKDAFVVLCTIGHQLNDIIVNIDYLRQFNAQLAPRPTSELLQLRRQLCQLAQVAEAAATTTSTTT